MRSGQGVSWAVATLVGFVLIGGLFYKAKTSHFELKLPEHMGNVSPDKQLMAEPRIGYIDRSLEKPANVWNEEVMFRRAWGHVTASWNPNLGIGYNLTHPDPQYSAPCWREAITPKVLKNAYKHNRYIKQTYIIIGGRVMRMVSRSASVFKSGN